MYTELNCVTRFDKITDVATIYIGNKIVDRKEKFKAEEFSQ